jgi:hypothetical protein
MRYPGYKLKLSKLDAAQRQFRVATRLWFTGADPVAIHTLACAAHEVVHTLFERAGLQGLLFDADFIQDKHRSDWIRVLRRNANFLKHADRDPDAEIEFNSATNEGLLMACFSGLQRLGASLDSVEERCFHFWLRVHYPSGFGALPVRDSLPVNLFQEYGHIERDDFFEEFQILWLEGRAPGQTRSPSPVSA